MDLILPNQKHLYSYLGQYPHKEILPSPTVNIPEFHRAIRIIQSPRTVYDIFDHWMNYNQMHDILQYIAEESNPIKKDFFYQNRALASIYVSEWMVTQCLKKIKDEDIFTRTFIACIALAFESNQLQSIEIWTKLLLKKNTLDMSDTLYKCVIHALNAKKYLFIHYFLKHIPNETIRDKCYSKVSTSLIEQTPDAYDLSIRYIKNDSLRSSHIQEYCAYLARDTERLFHYFSIFLKRANCLIANHLRAFIIDYPINTILLAYSNTTKGLSLRQHYDLYEKIRIHQYTLLEKKTSLTPLQKSQKRDYYSLLNFKSSHLIKGIKQLLFHKEYAKVLLFFIMYFSTQGSIIDSSIFQKCITYKLKKISSLLNKPQYKNHHTQLLKQKITQLLKNRHLVTIFSEYQKLLKFKLIYSDHLANPSPIPQIKYEYFWHNHSSTLPIARLNNIDEAFNIAYDKLLDKITTIFGNTEAKDSYIINITKWFEKTLETKDAEKNPHYIQQRVITIVDHIFSNTDQTHVAHILGLMYERYPNCPDAIAQSLDDIEEAIFLFNNQNNLHNILAYGIRCFLHTVIQEHFCHGYESIESYLYLKLELSPYIRIHNSTQSMLYPYLAMHNLSSQQHTITDCISKLLQSFNTQCIISFLSKWQPLLHYLKIEPSLEEKQAILDSVYDDPVFKDKSTEECDTEYNTRIIHLQIAKEMQLDNHWQTASQEAFEEEQSYRYALYIQNKEHAPNIYSHILDLLDQCNFLTSEHPKMPPILYNPAEYLLNRYTRH